MARLLGLDLGERRIGLALSDESGLIAQGLPTLQRTNLRKDLAALKNLLEKYEVETVVLGLPLNLDGSCGPRARAVLEFKKKLQNCLPVPVISWDERLSTQAAQRCLRQADLKWRKRRKLADQLSAVIILQNYLDYRRQRQKDNC